MAPPLPSPSASPGGDERRAIFVTGAGSGIGRATAIFFAEQGWLVGLADINANALLETESAMPPGTASRHALDVRDRDQWAEALAAFFARSGRLDLLCNNAGVVSAGRFMDVAAADHDRTIDINLTGVMNGAGAGFAYLARTPGSALVNICSAAGLIGMGGMATYAASKFAVRGFSEALDQEWAEHGIRVRTIMPGFIDTPLLDATAAGSNQPLRETVQSNGLELTSPTAVAAAVLRASQSEDVHHLVGPLARRLARMVRIAPRWSLRNLRKKALKDAKTR